MGMKCKSCKFYRRLKYNFQKGIGFDESHCCVLFEYMDKYDPNEFIVEVYPNDTCECFTGKEV